ncbi:MAG TPA: dihydrofolate reductase family protein [Vicinamibacteria bacterium]|nr:dihydrofolate reductase family protein [Vicinamibacteria bacterium]
MTPGRKVVVSVATSADGYIARKDGAVEWLDRPRPRGDYGMPAFMRSVDTVLWGRKTYEMALGFGQAARAGIGHARNCVFSTRPPASMAPGFELVREPLPEFMRALRAREGRDVWVMGGAGLIASLLDVGEVDAIVVHVVPVLIGEGIPLLAPQHRLVPLRLASVREFADGVVRLHYLVPRHARRNES